MSDKQRDHKVYEAIERRVERLYAESSKNIKDPVSGQFSGSRIGNDGRWRTTKSFYIRIRGEDEDDMHIKEEAGLRIATKYSGIWHGDRIYTIRDRFEQTIPLVSLSTIGGDEPRLTLNTRYSSTNGETSCVQYLPSGQMGDGICTSLNGMPASPNEVIGLFRSYTNVVTAVMLGATVAESLEDLVISDHRATTQEDYRPDYEEVTGRWTD